MVAVVPGTRRGTRRFGAGTAFGQYPRRNSTKYWHRLMYLEIPSRDVQTDGGVYIGNAARQAGFIPFSANDRDKMFGMLKYNSTSSIKSGRYGRALRRDGGSLTYGKANSDDTMVDELCGQAIFDNHGLTHMMWWQHDDQSYSNSHTQTGMGINCAGNWNNAEGFRHYADNALSRASAQNGTSGRGFGDEANTGTGSVADGGAGLFRVSIASFSKNGVINVAHKAWDLSGHTRSDTGQVTGNIDISTTTNNLAHNFNRTAPMGGQAWWRGTPFSLQEMERMCLIDPAELFYG
jgi:hypothetical protein